MFPYSAARRPGESSSGYHFCMDGRRRRSAASFWRRLGEGLEADGRPQDDLRVSKRGIYLITGDSHCRTFQLIDWEQILKRVQAPIR